MDQRADQIKREIEEARERISETTTELGDRIRSTFDWRQQVADHPWAAVGMAASVGFLLGAGSARAMSGGGAREADLYGEPSTYDRTGREAEMQAPPPGAAGAEWAAAAGAAAPGAGPGPEAEEAARARSEAERARDREYRSGPPREERGGLGAQAASLTGILASSLGPQLQEISRNFAEQLKDLSNHFIAQGKDYLKERVDEWRSGAGRGRGSAWPGGPRARAGGPAPGGSTLTAEAAGTRPSEPTTGTGPTAGSGTPPGGPGPAESRSGS